MKTMKIIGLRHCPVCGAPSVMRKNASKRFQIHCTKCTCCTSWTDKASAIIKWYNNARVYEETHGIVPPQPADTVEDKLENATQTLSNLMENYRTGGTIKGAELEKIANQLLKLAKE